MKIIIFIILLISNSFNIPSTNNYDCTGKIKGLLVIKYIKNEIVFSVKNETLKNEGESYKKTIDFTTEKLFFPINDVKIENSIRDWNAFGLKDVYFLPTSQNKVYFDKLCPSKSGLMKIIDLSKQKDCIYYTIIGDEKYIYKIYYIEGNETNLKLKNNELNKVKLDLSDEIDKDIEMFNVHFIYDIRKIECNKKIDGFIKWEY